MSNTQFLNKIHNKSIVNTVIDQIVNAIIEGNFVPGERIPTESELSESFGIGRSTVREAVKILVSYGILEIRRADGTYVCQNFSANMLNPMLYGIILERGNNEHLTELRHILDVGTLQLAIIHADKNDINEMQNCIDSFAQALENPNSTTEEISELDHRFHSAVEQATHNPIFSNICSFVSKLTRFSQLQTNKVVMDMQEKQYLLDTHKRILDTIINRDSSKITDVITDSYKYWFSYMSSRK